MEDIKTDDGFIYLSPPSTAHRRGHLSLTLLVSKTRIEVFEGSAIEGVITSELANSSKNGKWSTSSYRCVLNPHWEAVHLMQGWETGEFCTDCSSMGAIQKELKLSHIPAPTVRTFLSREDLGWRSLKNILPRHDAFMEALAVMEEAGIEDTMEVTHEESFINNRCGHRMLVIDGVVWQVEREWQSVPNIIIKSLVRHSGRGSAKTWVLIVPTSCVIEEVTEGGYDDDNLEGRGYIRGYNQWQAPRHIKPEAPAEEVEPTIENLLAKFKKP